MTAGINTRRVRTLRQDEKGMSGLKLSFLLGAIGALAIFLPFLVVDKGFFLYCGDYNEQQVPFYYYLNGFIKSGGGTWSWATDMGSSVVNSYSFYNLGSPFLWLTLIFPQSWMPYLMVPIFMAKFGCISGAAYLWMDRYAKTRNMAVIASVVYAFCGFNVYNIFFNHMLEPVIYFPLMLWALDGFVYDKKRGWFALFVGLALINSYFFFLGNVVFVLLYFIVKVACGEYRLELKEFGLLAFEAVLGVAIGMVLALPSFYNLIGNPRVDNFTNGFGFLQYGNVQQYFAILQSMFLPPDPPYLPNIFTEGAIKWTSMSLFLPIVGMGGVFAYCRSRKGGSTKKLLFISLIMMLVPILNSSYYAFNASYYARWYYMPLLIACFATLRSLEDADIDLEKGVRLAAILTGVFVLFGLVPTLRDGEWILGVAQYASKFWLTWLTAMFSILVFWLVVHFYRGKVRFGPLLLGAVMGFSVFYSVIHIALGKFPQWERDANYRLEMYEGSAVLNLPEDQFYRIDTYNTNDNFGLWANKSSIRTFNSTVTPSIMEFYPMVGVKRDVSSKPETDVYALRGLLGVRYTIMPTREVDNFLAAPGTAGWRYLETQGPFAIFENENFVPMGFTYDQYVRMDDLTAIRTDDRAGILMRAIGLTDEQVGRFARYFEGNAVSWEPLSGSGLKVEEQTGGWYRYDAVDYHNYVADCDARRGSASYSFTADASGFTSRIVLQRENLVFFGVPYDEGFTATVNGEKAEVLKVSGGMMAVVAPAGDNEIVFRYATPGLKAGAVISLVAVLVLAAYLVGSSLYRKRGFAALRLAGKKSGQQGESGGGPENRPEP